MNTTDNPHYNWPLVLIDIGGHEPQWVADTLARVNALDGEMLTVIMSYMIIVARDEVGRN